MKNLLFLLVIITGICRAQTLAHYPCDSTVTKNCDTTYKVDKSYWQSFACNDTVPNIIRTVEYTTRKDSVLVQYSCGSHKRRRRTIIDYCWKDSVISVADSIVTYQDLIFYKTCSTYVSNIVDSPVKRTCTTVYHNTCDSILTAPPTAAIKTKFGILIAASITSNTAEAMRQTALTGALFVRKSTDINSALSPAIGQFYNSGYLVSINVNPSQPVNNVAVAYPSNMAAFVPSYTQRVNEIAPYAYDVVFGNEWWNHGYYFGPIADYITGYKNAVTIAHNKSLKITDGGFPLLYMQWKVRQDYLARGFVDSAASFVAKAFDSRLTKAINGRDAQLNGFFAMCDSVYNALTDIKPDYINLHAYNRHNAIGTTDTYPAYMGIKEIVQYVKRTTGLDVACNEGGQWSDNPEDTRSLVAEMKGNVLYCIIWSGDKDTPPGARSYTRNGILTPTGEAFRDAIK